jgi:hypothetical protein
VVLAFDDIPVCPSAHMPSIVFHVPWCLPTRLDAMLWECLIQPPLATPTSAENGLLNNEVTFPTDHLNFHNPANGSSRRLNTLLFTAAVK